nr:hypothetical protein [Tanacetum cinerariifolium]
MHDCHLELIFLDGLYGVESRVHSPFLFFQINNNNNSIQKINTAVDWKFFGGPTYLVLVESMERKSEQSQFTSRMHCRTTGNVQRFNLAFEVALVQQSGLVPAIKEPVVFDRIGVGKRLLSNTFSPCVPVGRSKPLSPVAESISVITSNIPRFSSTGMVAAEVGIGEAIGDGTVNGIIGDETDEGTTEGDGEIKSEPDVHSGECGV